MRNPVVDIIWAITENHGFIIRFETQIRGFHPLAYIMSVDHIMPTTGIVPPFRAIRLN